jgi:hypothetical protein
MPAEAPAAVKRATACSDNKRDFDVVDGLPEMAVTFMGTKEKGPTPQWRGASKTARRCVV